MLPPLDSRKVTILQAIVNDYVQTTRPVGSERLIEVYHLNCKSATVRNEMAEMAELGYLMQPHTSAGRIPTDQGYRFYVNVLMNPPGALAPDEARRARADSRSAPPEVDEIILQTCRILSQMTACASLATDPSTATTSLRRVYLTVASARQILVVALLSTGHVEHRLVDVGSVPEDRLLTQLTNYANLRLADQDLDEVARVARSLDVPVELQAYTGLLGKVFATLQQMAAAMAERRVFVEGTSQFLRQPEFQDVQRLENLLNALAQRRALFTVLSRALPNSEAAIIIGTENEYAPMQECSIVSTAYRIGSRTAGYLGVVGPTRMNYDRAVAAVGLMAANLSQMLTSLSIA